MAFAVGFFPEVSGQNAGSSHADSGTLHEYRGLDSTEDHDDGGACV